MNVLRNQLSQNWQNYKTDIKPSNPLGGNIVRKMGGKRKGVLPNNLNSGRQMTFVTSKRNNFSTSPSGFANFATLKQDAAANGAEIEAGKLKEWQNSLKDSKSGLKEARQRGDKAFEDLYEKRAGFYKDTITNTARGYSDTDYNLKKRIATNKQRGTESAERQVEKDSNKYSAKQTKKRNNRIKESLTDSINDTMKSVNEARNSDTAKQAKQRLNDSFNENMNAYTTRMNEAHNELMRTKGMSNRTKAAIGGAAILAGGLGVYLNNRNNNKKKKEANYTYMSDVIVNFASSTLPKYSKLTEAQKKALSPEELQYLKEKEEKEDNQDRELKQTASKRASYRAGLDTAREGRGWINSGTAIARESRSWLKFLGLGN